MKKVLYLLLVIFLLPSCSKDKISDGVVFINDNITKNDTIKFFNKDGSLWYVFSFFYDDSDGNFEFYNEEFAPLAFHPDYFLLSLTTVGKSNNQYEVIVNEENKLRKYLNDASFITFQTIEEYVLSNVSSIEFNSKNNPLLENPNKNSTHLPYDEDQIYIPNKINEEWLQVKWEVNNNWNYGWVKWKENKKIIIKFFHII